MEKFTLFFILVSFQFSLFAQNQARVSGVVKTTESEALPYANVSLTDKTDKSKIYGVATDSSGKYSIPVPPGHYTFEISFVGYAKYISSIELTKDVNIPEIILNQESNLIDEAVVKARTITYKSNGYTVGISNNPFYKEHELDNILKLTPGTNINPLGDVTVYGKSVSKIYVNNMEVRLQNDELLQYLKNFNGRNVKNIEVITASGVEDDASSAGSSIIRITTKKMDDGGRLSISAGYSTGKSKAFLTPNMNLQLRTGKWSSYLMCGSASGTSTSTNKTETEFYESGIKTSTENKIQANTKYNYRTTLGTGYNINEHNLLIAEIFFRSSLHETDRNSTSGEWNPNMNEFIQTTAGFSGDNKNQKKFNASLNYTHLFGKTGKFVLMFDRLEHNGDNKLNNQYMYNAGDNILYKDYNNENNIIYTAGINYKQSFKKLNSVLTSGLKYSDISNENITNYDKYINQTFDTLASYTDVYHYNEKIYAAFTKYSLTHKSISATLGVRLEHSIIYPRSADHPDQSLKRDYTDLFPETGINWSLNKDKGHNISINYNRSIIRPGIYSLNPLIIRENEYTYNIGNPFLKPTYSNNFSLASLLFNKYLLNASYSVSKSSSFTKATIDPGTGILYNQSINGMKSSQLKIYAEYPMAFGKWGNLKLNGSFYMSESEYQQDKKSTSSWSVRINGMFRLPYSINVMADISYSPGRKTLYYKSYAGLYSTLHISKSFFKNQLATSLLFNDIFGMFGKRRHDNFSDIYYQQSKNTYNSFGIALRASYNIKWGNKAAKFNRSQTGNSNEQGRISND